MARDALPPRLLWYMPAGAGEAWKGVGVCARADTAASPEASPPRHTQGKEAAMCARGTHALTRPRVAVGRPSCQVKRRPRVSSFFPHKTRIRRSVCDFVSDRKPCQSAVGYVRKSNTLNILLKLTPKPSVMLASVIASVIKF